MVKSHLFHESCNHSATTGITCVEHRILESSIAEAFTGPPDESKSVHSIGSLFGNIKIPECKSGASAGIFLVVARVISEFC